MKQSRAREIDPVPENRPSAPSSTAGVDADDDESSIPSPEVRAADAGDVSDMLEPKAAGPSILRLTDTDKVKQKEKKVKATGEGRDQEAAPELPEGRGCQGPEGGDGEGPSGGYGGPAKTCPDIRRAGCQGRVCIHGGSGQALGLEGQRSQRPARGSCRRTETSSPSSRWIPLSRRSLRRSRPRERSPWPTRARIGCRPPSEEEQIEQLLANEEWNTVKTKKSTKKKGGPTETQAHADSAVTAPQQVTPVVSQPVVTKSQKAKTSKPAFSQQSSFAALSTEEPEEVEEEWDV